MSWAGYTYRRFTFKGIRGGIRFVKLERAEGIDDGVVCQHLSCL